MKLPDLIRKELEALSCHWHISEGSKHYKLHVNGVFCGIISKGRVPDHKRAWLNVRSQIRRAAAGIVTSPYSPSMQDD